MADPSHEKPAGIGDIDEIVGFHLRLAHGAVYRHFTETFAELGLTQKQVSVLWLIEAREAKSQSELAARMQMDRATTMAIVRRLEGRGFVSRSPSPDDGRRQILVLTPEGTRALADARTAIALHEGWLKSRFTASEVETLIALLKRIHE